MIATKTKFYKNKVVNGELRSYYIMDIVGLSTDTKPTEMWGNKVEEGSTFFEMDTSKAFMMKPDYTWVEI